MTGARSDSQPISSTDPKGTTTITWTANDGTQTTTATQTVTVTDNEAPTLICPTTGLTLNVVPNTCAANYTIVDPITDNCTSATWGATFTGSVISNPPPANFSGIADGANSNALSFNRGSTTVVLSGTDGTNAAATCSFTVTVTDNQNPTITAPPTVIVMAIARMCLPLQLLLARQQT